MKRLILFIIAILLLPIFTYSSAICINKPDEFIIKCTLDEKYFIQDFTCLNSDCSYKIENNKDYQQLIVPWSHDGIILKNNLELKDVYRDLTILNSICTEKFDDNDLSILNKKVNEQFSNKLKSYSGEKNTIEYNNAKNYQNILNLKENKDLNVDNCYTIKIENTSNWIIKTNTRKEYCTIDYDEDNDCFTTNMVKNKYLMFLISNPQKTYTHILIYSIILTVIIVFSLFIINLKKKKKLIKFLKPSKHKLLIKLVLIVPMFYLIGLLINYIVNKKYYFFMTFYLEIFIIIVSIVVIYFLSALIEYFFIEKK